jgi:hypothetical protein
MSATSEQNKVLVRRLWEAMNNRQLEALDALLAPDVVRHCEATPGAASGVWSSSRILCGRMRQCFPIPCKRSRISWRREI